MPSQFNNSRNIFFWVLLVASLGLFYTYHIPLRDKSLPFMLAWQKAHPVETEPFELALADWLEGFTGTERYYQMCFMLFPFVSRPRFFYLLLGFVSCDVVKNIIKLGYHMPRPLWLWSDLQCYAAEKTFANPSGHTARASFITVFLLLDFFFASDYARETNPKTNKRSFRKDKLAACILLVAGLCYLFGLAYLVFVTGNHTMDQLLLGLQFGLWLSFYLHFCWRDLIYDHISFITNVPTLKTEKAFSNMLIGSLIWGTAVLMIFSEMFYLYYFWDPEQSWI